MNNKEKAQQVVNRMLEADAFSQWLGMEVIALDAGYAHLEMTVRPDMLNGFGIAHGAITFALADSALAFASNSHGRKAVSIETSISHTRPVNLGTRLRAVAREEHLGNKTANYRIQVYNEAEEVVALFAGIVYRTGREWTF